DQPNSRARPWRWVLRTQLWSIGGNASDAMNYSCLATDYDGTIAQHGDVCASTYEALKEWKESGRKLILVTGREMPDLMKVCPFTALFDRIVAENGGLLYFPVTGEATLLAPAPPEKFIELLRHRGVKPLSIGRVIVSTQEVYKGVVEQAINELGFHLQVILNKGAVMVLPGNVDKATGLRAALAELKIASSHVVGTGDAENDHVF